MSRLRLAWPAALAMASILVVGDAAGASAQEGDCVLDADGLNCETQAPVTEPSVPPGQGGPAGGGPVSPTTTVPSPQDLGLEVACPWRPATPEEAAFYRSRYPDLADGTIQVCDDDNGVGIRVVPDGGGAGPEDVAADYVVEAHARMRAPQVVTDPPLGSPSLITLPVFVQVTNWVDAFEINECDRGVCVSLSATPRLSFDPGEPGSTPIACEPPGTRFDPAGADPVVQASAPGACAHVYRSRTGAGDRPDEWPGRVIVTWAVSWTAAGVSGEEPPYELATPVPRQVDEVQTVVRSGAG